jgi:hypothetical protein
VYNKPEKHMAAMQMKKANSIAIARRALHDNQMITMRKAKSSKKHIQDNKVIFNSKECEPNKWS